MRTLTTATHSRRAMLGSIVVFIASASMIVGGCSRSPGASSLALDGSASTAAAASDASRPADQVAMRAATIPVDGMSCGSCVARLKRGLKPIDGVTEVHVSLEQRNAVVRYDQGKVSADRLVAAINELGYTAGTPAVTPVEAGGS